jgi:hypothetical protein
MAMTSVSKDRLLAIKAEMEEKQKELQKRAREVFHEEIQGLFATYPELQSVSWTQYTPYFNDGDECIFRCGGNSSVNINLYGPDPETGPLTPKGDYEAESKTEHYFSRYSTNPAPAESEPWQKRAAWDVTRICSTLGDSLMKDIFGDHVLVMIGRDKIVVDNYEHE